MAGRYDNPIPLRFLAPINFLKIPALATQFQTQLLESIPRNIEGLTFPPQVTVGKTKFGETKYLTKRNIQELVGDLLQGSGQLVEKEHSVLGLDGAAQLERRLCDDRN
jgi:hypothetical protein